MAKSTAQSTQEHLPIAGIQDGTVIMTDGSIRVVLRAEPINFDLKSDQEQNAIVYAYQSFLNSLDFPIQIVIQSKKLDLERYLMRLQESQKQMTNDLLRIQTQDYVEFVRRLISVANIMSKRFYIVISYAALTKESGIAQIGSIIHRQPKGPVMDQDQFTRFRGEANNRASIIAGGIGRLGIKCTLLSTQELIELFYGIYNPDVATEERLTGDVGELNSQVISSPASQEQTPLAPVSPTQGTQQFAVPTQIAQSPLDEELSDQGMPVQSAPAPEPAQVPAAPEPAIAQPEQPTPPPTA